MSRAALQGRSALISGASQGLGAYLARRLAENGWAVTGFARTPGDEVEVVAGVSYVQADLSTDDAIASLVNRFPEAPDLVVHTAVVYPREPATLSLAELDAVFRVNAVAPYELTRRLLACGPADRPTTVVCVNSEAMFHADQISGVYGASKAALRVLAASLSASCRGTEAAVASLVLGPLATPGRVEELDRLARQHNRSPAELAAYALKKSNPDLVLAQFIDLDACYQSVKYIVGLGATANGMVCRLDGGSAGSLI